MKKIFFVSIFIFSLNSFSFQLEINDINGQLSKGKGDIKIGNLDLYAKPVGTKLTNFYADFSTDKNKLIFNYDGQIIELDLGVYKKLFEKQVFYMNDGNASFDQGKSIGINFSNAIFGLEKLNVDIKMANFSCKQNLRRGLGDELVELCLDEGLFKIGSLKLGEFFNLFFTPLVVQSLGPQKEQIPPWLIPGIQNISMDVNDGKYTFLGEVKFIGTTSLKSEGLINYDRNNDIISIKLDTLLVGSLSVKKVILKTLELLNLDYLEVKNDVILINVEKLESIFNEKL